MNNVVIVLGEQRMDSAIHRHGSILWERIFIVVSSDRDCDFCQSNSLVIEFPPKT